MVQLVITTLLQNQSILQSTHASTLGLKRSQTSTVKMVALLLNAEESEDIRAAIMTAIIRPTIPIGRMFRTSLESKNNNRQC